MRLTRLAHLAVLSAALSLCGGARADAPKIVLSITGCEAANVRADRLFELARTELAPRFLMPGDGIRKTPELMAIVSLCQGSSNLAVITVVKSGQRLAQRALDLSDVVGDMRARTLAVALAELVAALPSDQLAASADPDAARGSATDPLATEIAPPSAEALPVVPPPVTRDSASRPKSNQNSPGARLSAGAALRHFFVPSTWLLGPWISMTAHRISGEALFLTSKNQASDSSGPLGSVRIYNPNGAAAYRFLSFGDSPTLAARLRGELGWTWAKGISQDPAAVQGFTKSHWQGAALIELLLENPMSRSFGIEARLSSGVARGLTAISGRNSFASTDGFFVGAALGLCFGWRAL